MAHQALAPGPTERFDLDANDESFHLLQKLVGRYGDIFSVPTLSRATDSVVVNGPEDIRRVLLVNRENYVKGPGLERVRMLLGNGLIVSEGDLWARQRRMMQPAFSSSVNRRFLPMIGGINAALIERWDSFAEANEPVDVTYDLSSVALDIVLRALFSADFHTLIDRDGTSPFDLLTKDSRRDLQFAARFRSLTHYVRAIIGSRRHDDRIESDWLSMLMQAKDKTTNEPMPDRNLLDEVMTLIVAGHETTASTLNWMWYLLSQNQRARTELHAAIANAGANSSVDVIPPVGESAATGYVERLLNEALRMYPPVWLFSRRALKNDTLGGYHIPAGTDVFISPYLLHRNVAHWEDPELFKPERFAAESMPNRHRFAFLPFSAGPRFCIGAGFAMAEMAVHVTMVAARFELHHVGAEPTEAEFQINLRTRYPLRMRIAKRTPFVDEIPNT